MTKRLFVAGAAALLALVMIFAAVLAWNPDRADAEPLDPTLPQRRVVGAPAGASPMYRIDSARTGRANADLPENPKLLWRARVTGGIELPLAVDAKSRIVVASPMSQVSEFTPDGKLAWSARTGASAPSLGPVILSDGTRVVVTNSGELIGISPTGTLKYRRALPQAPVHGAAQPLATSDGGLVLVAGGFLLRLDASGAIQARASFADAPAALLERGARVLVVSDRGEVLEWKPPLEPTKLGSFGGRIDEGAALSSPNHLAAVVDHLRLVDLNLKSGTRHIRLDSTDLIQGPPAILPNGETRIASFSGLMLGHDRTGGETARVALEPSLPGSDAGATAFSNAPPLIVDAKGRVAFVRPGLDVGIVLASGEIKTAAGAACGDPLSLTPAGNKRLVLACRSGLVLMLGG